MVIKRCQKETFETGWKGPHTVILTMPTAVKMDGVPSWIHYSHTKPVDPHADPEDYAPEDANSGHWEGICSPTGPSQIENSESH